jgi:hypothetical protein
MREVPHRGHALPLVADIDQDLKTNLDKIHVMPFVSSETWRGTIGVE